MFAIKLYYLFTVDEKMPSSKNGSSPTNQMPTLDEEIDQKDTKEDKKKHQEKFIDGGNGKIVNKENEIKKDLEVIEENKDPAEPRWLETSDGQIEVEDPDDYLIYLEDILKRIHR